MPDSFEMKTFFLSREEIKNPLVDEIKKICVGIEVKLLSISARYGKRMLMASKGVSELSNFVEVVDYNPVNNIALVIGIEEPCDLVLHWLIYRREEINAIAHFTCKEGKYIEDIDTAMEVIKSLKDSNLVELEGYGKIAVGKSLRELKERIKC